MRVRKLLQVLLQQFIHSEGRHVAVLCSSYLVFSCGKSSVAVCLCLSTSEIRAHDSYPGYYRYAGNLKSEPVALIYVIASLKRSTFQPVYNAIITYNGKACKYNCAFMLGLGYLVGIQ